MNLEDMHIADDLHNAKLLNHIADDRIAVRDLLDLYIGPVIGYGVSRTVFHDFLDSNCVLKYDHDDQHANVREWAIWEELRDAPRYAKWLAPCMRISPCGKWLIQKMTTPVDKWPKKIPKFINADTKRGNFGLLDGQLVCHDYAYLSVMRHNENLLKLTDVKWW